MRSLKAIGSPPPGTDMVPVSTAVVAKVAANPMAAMGYALVHPSALPSMRVTSLQTFEKCPWTWAARYLNPAYEEVERTGAAAIGTAVHTIAEDFLWQIHGGRSPMEKMEEVAAAWAIVPENEHANVVAYLESLGDLPVVKPIAIEDRLNYRMIEAMPEISGQMDFVCTTGDGKTLMIVDHKTNRGYDDASWWRAQLQPLLYMWMARQEYPGYERYVFRIGYVNIGTAVQWETEAVDDDYLRARITQIWADMLKYAAQGEWPRTINDHCSWCEIKTICDSYANAHQNFMESVEVLRPQRTDAQLLEWVKQVKKIVEDEEKRLTASIKATLASGQLVSTDNYIYAAVYPEQRKADFLSVWQALNQWSDEHPEIDYNAMKPFLQDMFTVGVGAVDKFVEQYPSFGVIADQLCVKTPSLNLSLKTTAVKKAIKKK